MKENILRQLQLFASLPDDEIRQLANSLRTVEFAPQTILFREGEYGDRFYIVLSGEIEIIKAMATPDERRIDVRGAGEPIGEMSLLNRDGLRTASVRTRAPSQMLEMTRAQFDALLHRQPTLAYEMVRVLSERLSIAHNTTIRDLHEKNRQITQAYEELKAAHLQIVEKEKLERELAVARQIQQSILPRHVPHLPGFDFGARMVATRAVGGDFFDFVPLGNQRVAIAVADVSDKGVPAAIFMALTRSLLRAEALRDASPAETLRNVNRQLLDMNDADMFVTVWYGVIDSSTRQLNYVRAGHELPLVLDRAGNFVDVGMKGGQVLGVLGAPALDEEQLTLDEGGTLVVYTDGVTDQMNVRSEFFGIENLRNALRALHQLAAPAMCDQLLATLDTFRGAQSQSDDITFLVVRS